MLAVMQVLVLALAALALIALIVLLATWTVRVWCDGRDECRARDLERNLVRAIAQLREQGMRLAPLEELAARIQRQLWGRNRN